MAEKKLFQLVFLTLLAYGFVSFFQFGIFLVPLPIFEIVILGISVYFGLLNWTDDKRLAILFICFGFFQFLSQDYNYAFFLSDENLLALSSSVFVDLILLINGFVLLFLFISHNKSEIKPKWFLYLIAIALFLGLILPYQWFLLIPLVTTSIWYIKHNNIFEKQHSFWLILLIFSISRELTLFLL